MTISGYKKNKLQQIRGFCTVIEENYLNQRHTHSNPIPIVWIERVLYIYRERLCYIVHRYSIGGSDTIL